MKIPKTANAVGYIDDDLIANATENGAQTKRISWPKWGSVAACFAVLVIAGAAILPSLLGRNVTPSGNTERYKEFSIQAESGIIWPWEYRTVYEKYTNVEINGIEYLGKCRAVSEPLVGEDIGTYTVIGYDGVNADKKYTDEFEAYKLKDISQSRLVAVKMENSYYIFINNEYAPPSTLGELMNDVNLPNTVELNRFSENGDNPDSNYFVLTNDDYVWEVLAECKNAPFVEEQMWTATGRNYLSFTITSEALGVYKVALYITEDGYLWTNAFDYQYLFNIGKEAAGKIISYAKGNSAEAKYEPYKNSVIGTISQITDEYILVDDSVLCNNPADGITYKVMLNDLRISRYVNYGVVKVGDTVQISYEEEIDETNTVKNAISASKVTIFDGDALIPE